MKTGKQVCGEGQVTETGEKSAVQKREGGEV